MLRARATKGVGRILSTIGEKDKFPRDVFDGPDFAQKWASGDASTRREFMQILKRAELSMDDVMAEALAKKIDTFERIDRMLASAEARRNNALREIDRHRSALGRSEEHTSELSHLTQSRMPSSEIVSGD